MNEIEGKTGIRLKVPAKKTTLVTYKTQGFQRKTQGFCEKLKNYDQKIKEF